MAYTLIATTETLKGSPGRNTQSDENEAASNYPILLECMSLKLGPFSGLESVIREQAKTSASIMTLAQQIPTLYPSA